MLKEYDKVRLETGEVARIVEVLKDGVAYVAEVYKDDGKVSVEPVNIEDIKTVFVESEMPVRRVG